MTAGTLLLILIVGIAAGFLNTVGGGGSLLTMPMLIFLGMPSALANGTNRIALAVQNVLAVYNFRRKGYFDYKLGLLLGIPALCGSIAGAFLAIKTPDQYFNKILAGVMIVVLFLIIKKPAVGQIEENLLENPRRRLIAIIAFFFVGAYGGYIQAGIGFIIIAALSLLTGMSLVKINSLKVFIVFIYILSSLSIFIWQGKVDWFHGLALAVGNSAGAWLGTNFAVSKGDKWIRVILIITVSAMSLKLLFQ